MAGPKPAWNTLNLLYFLCESSSREWIGRESGAIGGITGHSPEYRSILG
jgi:hypothetical protein